MSTLDNTIASLRAELKQWEKDFALSHDGQKPTRADIKQDAAIAEKYSRFNKLSRPTTRSTPQKRRPLIERPTNITAIPTPTSCRTKEIQPTPAHIRCALGPTPQKDGFVLGIFDLFTAESPSKVDATPSKADIPAMVHSRTPQSSSKRFYFDAFAGTPLKRKREDDSGTPATAKRQFDTPAFLKRESMSTIHEEDGLFPARKPGARRGMARSLSAMIASLRKQEDDRMDEEWDILKELEAEEAEAEAAESQVKETQIEMPLGPDEAPVSDEDEPDPADATRKVWKKKGLKRQTKKVNMKPVLHAPQKAAGVEVDGGEDAAEPEGIIKKTVRKVNEAAHMNFRRLKIKHKNSKAKGRGRFGKR